MPIPKPKKGEDQKKFISRCMADAVTNKEYPDQKQRAAVCFSAWKAKEGLTFRCGSIVVREKFYSLQQAIRTAVKGKYGKNAWPHDFSNKEIIVYSEDWGLDKYRKISYKFVKGAVELIGAGETVKQVTSYENELTFANLVELADMNAECKVQE